MKFHVHAIVWDTDGESVDLPTETTVEVENTDRIADTLSDKFGWCVTAFQYDTIACIRALTAENEALRRERNEATSCAACGGPYPNADCGHARNAADVFQPAPCRPDTARAESSEALVAELREKVERLTKALEDIYRVGDGYDEHRPEDGKYAGTTGEGHARCRDIARRARSELEAGHE